MDNNQNAIGNTTIQYDVMNNKKESTSTQ